ncbi:MAG: hypothetical protein V8T34_05525 [Ruminococcus callidus]
MIHCAAIFTDHMLLQRGKPIAVFGTGTAGEPVTVSVPQRHCTVSSAVRQDGTWRLTLPPMPAGTGCTLTVNEQEFSVLPACITPCCKGQCPIPFGDFSIIRAKTTRSDRILMVHC